MKEVILVPHDRVNVIKDKETKKEIEKELNVKLTFDDNLIEIEGEGLELLNAKNIIRAIGRGFSPQNAFRLLKEDEQLEIVELKAFSFKKAEIIKSRIIGTKGKTRNNIERCSGCNVSVYGNTISIIGKYEQIEIAKEAITMIIKGSKHSTVYRFLEEAKM